ncbi:MAG: right-handed parallel beta-helix repeat-containing protein, partial [Planctomycetota bacterium]
EGYFPDGSVIRIIEASYLIIDGLRVRGVADRDASAVGAGHGIEIGGSHHITVRHCWVEYAGGGGISGTSYFWRDGEGHVATTLDHLLIEYNHVAFCGFYNRFQTSGISFYQPRSAGLGEGPDNFNIIIRGNRIWGCENKVNTSGHSQAECEANPGVPGYEWNQFTVTDGNGIIIDDFRCDQDAPGQGEDYPHRTLVENNIAVANGGRGIHVFMSDRVTVRHNTAWGNGLALPGDFKAELNNAFAADNHWYNNLAVASAASLAANSQGLLFAGGDSSGCTFAHNLVVGPIVSRDGGPTQWSQAELEAITLLSSDAKLVAPGDDPSIADFRLQADSPARDAGSNEHEHSTSVDIAGTSRPQGTAPDIGAFEWVSTLLQRRIHIMRPAGGGIWRTLSGDGEASDSEDTSIIDGLDPSLEQTLMLLPVDAG